MQSKLLILFFSFIITTAFFGLNNNKAEGLFPKTFAQAGPHNFDLSDMLNDITHKAQSELYNISLANDAADSLTSKFSELRNHETSIYDNISPIVKFDINPGKHGIYVYPLLLKDTNNKTITVFIYKFTNSTGSPATTKDIKYTVKINKGNSTLEEYSSHTNTGYDIKIIESIPSSQAKNPVSYFVAFHSIDWGDNSSKESSDSKLLTARLS